MRKTILLINGPPGSGKDFLADRIIDLFEPQTVVKEKMALPISEALRETFGFTKEGWSAIREEGKSKPIVEGFDTTLREAMISYSEDWLKKIFDDRIFAQLLFKRIQNHLDTYDLFVISDCGFQSEHDWFYEKMKETDFQVILVQLHRDGCDFSNDSREYVQGLPGQMFYSVDNQGYEQTFDLLINFLILDMKADYKELDLSGYWTNRDQNKEWSLINHALD